MNNITIVGAGYVGLSIAVVSSKKYSVIALDIDKDKNKLINKRISPIKDNNINQYLKKIKNNLHATHEKNDAYKKSDIVIICTPTNYNEKTNKFDTKSISMTIRDILNINRKAIIVIKSTIPIGFTEKMKQYFNYKNIIFSPEFLTEGNSIEDTLNPTRIIIGSKNKMGKKIGSFFKSLSVNKKCKEIFMDSHEAEAVKLFSNTYLAMRVSFFNELDSYCETNNISALNLINGISSDPRIGNYYNNPSFGYGGYCLPKDTKQLVTNFKNVPNNIIKSVVEANMTRKKFVAKSILSKNPKIVGVYRLAMKKNSTNFRESAIIDVLKIIKKMNNKIKIVIYEPSVKNDTILNFKIEKDLKKFIKLSSIIVANRKYKQIESAKNKIYSRDLFGVN
tara:strand:- start:148 stop:1323 length:1176 start_codon:yes stop_codon:yes gene_type:complete